MKPTIFNDKVVTALKNWHRTAKKNTKHSHHSESTTPFSSRPATPTHGMSPVLLLHNYHHSSLDSTHASPTRFNVENDHSDIEDVPSPSNISGPNENLFSGHSELQERPAIQDPSSMQLPPAPGPIRTQHEINIGSSDFSFSKWISQWRLDHRRLLHTYTTVYIFCTWQIVGTCAPIVARMIQAFIIKIDSFFFFSRAWGIVNNTFLFPSEQKKKKKKKK